MSRGRLAVAVLLAASWAAAPAQARGSGTSRDPAVQLVVIVVLGSLLLWFFGRRWLRTRERRRHHHTVAAAATGLEPAFAEDAVVRRARRVFETAVLALDTGDRERLATVAAPELVRRWTDELDDRAAQGLRRRVKLRRVTEVAYAGFADHPGEDADRVIVDITCTKVEDYLETENGVEVSRRPGDWENSEFCRIEERWTLARHEGDWRAVDVIPSSADREATVASGTR